MRILRLRAFAVGWLLIWSCAATPAVGDAAPAARAGLPLRVERVDAVGFTVSDLDRSVAFFSEVLSFKQVRDIEVAGEAYERLQGVRGLSRHVVRMQLGDEAIELSEYRPPRGRPIAGDSRSNDLWFQHLAIVVSDMDRAYAWLQRHAVEPISLGPQRLPDWNRAAAGIRAFYFKDPDGHPLELLEFPPDKGAAKWHRRAEGLFLGIDHTAIVVRDTAASLSFYRDTLGLKVAGESENYGSEQEHLSKVDGAHLNITGLRAAAGPGIELLDYLSPRDGRALPSDASADDLSHWQTRMVAEESALPGFANIRGGGITFVSPGVVRIPQGEMGFGAALLVRDPDGHALEVAAPAAP